MTKIESLELIEEWFMKTAFEQVRQTHADQIADDVDALPFAWKLLYAAHDKFEQALSIGKSDSEALLEASTIFISKSIQL